MSIPYGVHLDMPASQYHAIKAASASRLRTLWSKTPGHLLVEMQEPKKVTPEMMLGTLCHQKILEPHVTPRLLSIPPEQYPAPSDSSLVKTGKVSEGDLVDWSWSATYCKRWRKQQEEAGCLVVSEVEAKSIDGACLAAVQHPIVSELLQGARTEVSLVTTNEDFGVSVKARLDLVPRGPDLADFKFTYDANPKDFVRNAYDRGLHIQAAFYLDMWNAMCGIDDPKTGFKFIAVESKPFHGVNVFSVSPELIELGREDYTKALETWAECSKTGVWPGYTPIEHTIEVPRWRRKEIQ